MPCEGTACERLSVSEDIRSSYYFDTSHMRSVRTEADTLR